MVASLRFLARSVLFNCRLHAHAPATSVVFRSRASCSIGRLPPQRALQTSAVSTVGEEQTTTSAPKETPGSKPALPGDPSWRHPRLGFPAADLPRLVRINLPPNTTEEDVKLLLAGAGYSNAELTMYYHFETGTNIGPCYVKLAEKKEVPDAIAALSEFTLRGAKLRVQGYDPEFDNIHYQPDLAAGWLPSPSSELEVRVHRPPITTKPQLLPPLMAEQWLQLQGLPRLDPDRKGARFEMLRELYNRFHSYDVVGITRIREHRIKRNGWTCRILFGNHRDATSARKSFVGSKFMGNKIYAKTYRAGPDVHSRLWKYRESLPEDTPPEKIGDLLEMKYKELLVEQRKISSRSNYPTPSSAVGLKEDTGTTT